VKIVVAQDALHAEGGVESYLAAIIPAMRKRGHSIALLFVRRRSGTPLVGDIDGPVVGVDSERNSLDVPPVVTDWENYGGITRSVSLISVPETFIVKGDGKLVFKLVGPISAQTLESQIKPQILKAMD